VQRHVKTFSYENKKFQATVNLTSTDEGGAARTKRPYNINGGKMKILVFT
jgi:hypothetical protein